MIDILLKEANRSIDIFAITETHLQHDIKDGELNLDDYIFVRKDRETGIGGGVGCFIREDVKWQRRTDLERAGLEALWLEIFVKNSKSFLVCILYRPPNSSKHLHKDFESIFQDMLSTAVCEDKETILLGDLNADYLRQ
jgi:exonuclease III